MENIVSGTTGLIHIIASIIALVTGLLVLTTIKGTKRHKQIGYVYVVSMILLNLTAFMIYRLYGKFGIFHWFAVISCLTLCAGLYPILSKRSQNYIELHFNYMYWSVIGLYCAFMAEIFSRLPKYVLTKTGEPMIIFYKFIGIGIAIVMAIGIFIYIKYEPIWKNRYKRK